MIQVCILKGLHKKLYIQSIRFKFRQLSVTSCQPFFVKNFPFRTEKVRRQQICLPAHFPVHHRNGTNP